jgi:hypothetical protein
LLVGGCGAGGQLEEESRLEAVQVFADLDLSIKKAYISSHGRWFMG